MLLNNRLIFALRLSNLTANHQFFDSTTIQLRHQSFGIRLDDKPQVGTQIRRNLLSTVVLVLKHSCFISGDIFDWQQM